MKGEYSGDVKVESGCDISCKNETGNESGNLQIHRGHDTSCENESGGNSGGVQFEQGPPALDNDSPPVRRQLFST